MNINNIDPAPSVSIVGPSSVVNEGNDADLGVILSQAAGAPVTIFYNTSDGTATSGENYYGLSSSTIIPIRKHLDYYFRGDSRLRRLRPRGGLLLRHSSQVQVPTWVRRT